MNDMHQHDKEPFLKRHLALTEFFLLVGLVFSEYFLLQVPVDVKRSTEEQFLRFILPVLGYMALQIAIILDLLGPVISARRIRSQLSTFAAVSGSAIETVTDSISIRERLLRRRLGNIRHIFVSIRKSPAYLKEMAEVALSQTESELAGIPNGHITVVRRETADPRWEKIAKEAKPGETIIATSCVDPDWWLLNKGWQEFNQQLITDRGVKIVRIFIFNNQRELELNREIMRRFSQMGAQIHIVLASSLVEVGLRDMMLVGVEITDFNNPINSKKEVIGGRVLGHQHLAGDRIHWESLTVSWQPEELENARKTFTTYLRSAKRYDDDEWFKDFFVEDLPVIIRHKDTEAADEVKGVTSLLSLPQYSQVLDLGCGYGRIAIPLSLPPHLLNLTAVDVSIPLINKARELYTVWRSKHTNFGQIDWIPDDILDLKQRADIKEKYDAAISVFTSFGYYHKDKDGKDSLNLETLKIAAYALKKNGKLIIDVDNSAPFIDDVRKKPEHDAITVPNSREGYKTTVIHRYDGYDGTAHRRLSSFLLECKLSEAFTTSDKPDVIWISKPLVSVQLYTYTELCDLLSQAGFKVLDVRGDWQLAAYSARLSPRLIILAIKNN